MKICFKTLLAAHCIKMAEYNLNRSCKSLPFTKSFIRRNTFGVMCFARDRRRLLYWPILAPLDMQSNKDNPSSISGCPACSKTIKKNFSLKNNTSKLILKIDDHIKMQFSKI